MSTNHNKDATFMRHYNTSFQIRLERGIQFHTYKYMSYYRCLLNAQTNCLAYLNNEFLLYYIVYDRHIMKKPPLKKQNHRS